jgi:hypothetical protein
MMAPDDLAAVYLASVRASERLRDDRQKAAEQAHADVTAQADQDYHGNPDRAAGARNRDRVYALTGDGRQGVYDRAAQDHFDRVAAAQRHFGQSISARGNPDAPHAQAWLRGLDVDEFAAQPEPPPIGRPILAEHHPGMPVPRRIDERGIIVAETFTLGARRPPTFSGDAAAARRFATMTSKERAEAAAWVVEQAQSVTADVSDTSAAAPEPIPEPAPPGLLADIAKALGKSS